MGFCSQALRCLQTPRVFLMMGYILVVLRCGAGEVIFSSLAVAGIADMGLLGAALQEKLHLLQPGLQTVTSREPLSVGELAGIRNGF